MSKEKNILFDESDNSGRGDTQSLEEMPYGAHKMTFRSEKTVEYMPEVPKEVKEAKKRLQKKGNKNAIRRMAGEEM